MKFKCGITPEKIVSLKLNEIFVFGSNTKGIHGKGAAKIALMKFGAVYGKGEGLMGKSYGLPTKFTPTSFMSLWDVEIHVNKFYKCVLNNSNKHFLITKVGCNLAGFKVRQIAPLFKDFIELENCSLPQEFIDVILNDK